MQLTVKVFPLLLIGLFLFLPEVSYGGAGDVLKAYEKLTSKEREAKLIEDEVSTACLICNHQLILLGIKRISNNALFLENTSRNILRLSSVSALR